jgi:hypothetical protein
MQRHNNLLKAEKSNKSLGFEGICQNNEVKSVATDREKTLDSEKNSRPAPNATTPWRKSIITNVMVTGGVLSSSR